MADDPSAAAEETPAEAEAEAEDAKPGYTIDELASVTGVPSRTIRFYQAKGALQAPERRGRVAYYGDEHVERLQLVGHLQDRGLSLKAIRDLIQRAEVGGFSVGEWLGIGDLLQAPWTEDRPRLFTEQELLDLLGEAHRPGLVADLVRAELLRREGAGEATTYMCPSPGLLQIALKLDAAGISLDAAEKAHEILRRRLGRAADELAQFFIQRADEDALDAEEVGRSLEALRSIGVDAVRLVFAQEIERALREMVEQGRAMPPRRPKKPAERRRERRRQRKG
ncbi:MAG: MerR family transcriptional regulator [Myxococcota bacterium]